MSLGNTRSGGANKCSSGGLGMMQFTSQKHQHSKYKNTYTLQQDKCKYKKIWTCLSVNDLHLPRIYMSYICTTIDTYIHNTHMDIQLRDLFGLLGNICLSNEALLHQSMQISPDCLILHIFMSFCLLAI